MCPLVGQCVVGLAFSVQAHARLPFFVRAKDAAGDGLFGVEALKALLTRLKEVVATKEFEEGRTTPPGAAELRRFKFLLPAALRDDAQVVVDKIFAGRAAGLVHGATKVPMASAAPLQLIFSCLTSNVFG